MAETLLALPFFMLILLFMVYFGRGSVRVQRTQVMDRYQAWQEAGHGPGPSANDPRGNTQLNDTFFDYTADGIGHSGHRSFPEDAAMRWIADASGYSEQASQLADAMHENLARGRSAHFSTNFNHNNKLLQQFAGPNRHGHTVQDHDWKYVNGFPRGGGPWSQRGPHASNLGSVRDVFYEDWDGQLESMSENANPMARMIRGLYLDLPGYRGPEVP